jgi:hypothetical protein
VEDENVLELLEEFINSNKLVLKYIIPSISDVNRLIFYWNKVSSEPELKKITEQRIEEVLKEISKIEELICYWKESCPNSEPRKIIEQRIKEVSKEISDINKLIFYLEKILLDDEPGKIIEQRIREIIDSVSIPLPSWFISIIKKEAKIPFRFKIIIYQKSEELLLQLEK